MIELKIIGRLGSDAISKEINGQKVINFSLAHSHSYTNNAGQKVESTTWVRCEYWVKKDTLTQYLLKGGLVYCSGMPKVYAWQKEDRSIASTLQLRVTDLQLLGSTKRNDGNVSAQEAEHLNTAAGGEAPSFTPVAETIGAPDDLPF